MNTVTVAVLDRFSPIISGKLLSKLPRGWTLVPIGRATFKERKTAIKNAITGSNSSAVHHAALTVLVEGLKEIGLLLQISKISFE